MNLAKFLIVFLIAISISTPRAFAEIDWESGIVTAVGLGFSDENEVGVRAKKFARLAALVDAQRTLLEYTVGNSITHKGDNIIDFSVDKNVLDLWNPIIRKYEIISEKYDDKKGTYEVVISIPLYGKDSVASITFPKLISNRTPIPKIDSTILSPDEVESIKKSKFTALIIDIRGMKFEKSLAPNIYDPVGNLIYGFEYVDMNLAIGRGMVSYSKNLDDPRIGNDPLIIRAEDIEDENIIVTREDSERILIANQQSHFLENCNVIILY